jgi:gliding motility-associated-like protein
LTNLVEGEYVFELTVTDSNGNSDKDAVIINVTSSASASRTTIPRFFTPNGDGFGDFWVWPNDELYHNASLTVYNLSGQEVYESTNYQNTWDGTFDGQPLQAGHYQYVIRLKDSTQIRASVRIIRDKI